jgi:hypothetical protein
MKRVLLVTLSIFLVTGASCLGGDVQTPEGFLQNLYTSEHKPMTKPEIDFTKKESLAKYFDLQLTNLFIKDFECQKKEQGVCNLNFDPIYDAQDFDKQTIGLKVTSLAAQPNAFQVTFTNLGTRTLIYKLKKTSAGWRISDIKYPEGPSLKELLSREVK